ncbi:hypothetical protein P2G88_01360 [Aliiglaciecola sp. CAU 1673]|uniref:hypothetical protein n=1 Tax=Aliiglaciecola sp. CAU 1673 TaxID=3032595 RepID=UPI0023DC86A3|nr:hypothetical protein [Aliiglaciecola sp. CAU 1673]MDF2176899.1 hypothetical protein [Aliiglaciecola sp. CAU 1673]
MKVLLLLLILGLGGNAYAQSIEALVANGDWRSASGLLEQQRADCAQKKAEDPCHLQLRFTSAWLMTERAARLVKGDRQRALLELAKADYEAILQARPDHRASQDNLILVLQELGDSNGLLRQMRSIDDPKRFAELAQLTAQLLLQSGEVDQAFNLMTRAFAQRATDESLTLLLDAFGQGPDDNKAQTLLRLAARQQNIASDQLSRLLMAIIEQSSKLETETWVEAMLEWVEAEAWERQLTQQSVQKARQAGDNTMWTELSQRLADAHLGAPSDEVRLGHWILESGTAQGGWWTQNVVRAQVLAAAGWSQGHHLLIEGDIAGADAMWRGALYYAPNPQVYWSELKGKRAIPLEILTDLARINHLYKEQLDPNGEHFRQLESLLFASKSRAYEVNDLVAIQRHHSLLGKLYADMGRFESGVMGAKFQLTHAIRTSEKIAERTGHPDPQPSMAKLLADGYNCTLPNQSGCNSDKELAQHWYIQATMAYLDVDAVDRAEMTMQQVIKINPQLNTSQMALEQVIKTRKAVAGGGMADNVQWLEQQNQQLPQAFVDRQRFKVMSDLTLQGQGNQAEKALELFDVQKQATLPTDLIRIQQLKLNQSKQQ